MCHSVPAHASGEAEFLEAKGVVPMALMAKSAPVPETRLHWFLSVLGVVIRHDHKIARCSWIALQFTEGDGCSRRCACRHGGGLQQPIFACFEPRLVQTVTSLFGNNQALLLVSHSSNFRAFEASKAASTDSSAGSPKVSLRKRFVATSQCCCPVVGCLGFCQGQAGCFEQCTVGFGLSLLISDFAYWFDSFARI